MDNDSLRLMTNDDPLFAITLAKGLIDYVEMKANSTLDNSVAYMCRYWIMMNHFKLYYDAQKNGDSLTMEKIENDFCGVFLLLGKSKYYELCLSQAERRYNDATYGQLHEVRLNSACKYRKDSTHNVYTMHVLDELMENVNYWTKCLPLGNDEQSWIKHSPNVMVARRCLNFVNNEYRKGLLDFECAIQTDTSPIVTNNDNTPYVASKSTLERSRLFELVVELFDEEIEGREFNVKVAESKIELLTTKLKKNVTDNTPTTPLTTAIDGINSLQDTFNDNVDIHIINHSFNEIGGDVTSHDNRRSIENTTVNENDNDNNDSDDDNDSTIIDDDDDTNGTLLHVRSDCHRLSLVDVIEKGKDKMKVLDISNQRKNMKVLTECHDNFLLESFNKIMHDSTDSNNFPISDIGNQPTMISSFIKDFDELKKMHNNNETDFIAQFNMLQGR